MMRTTLFTKNMLFYNREFEPAEDYELWTRAMDIGKVENLSEILLHYRIHTAQVSQTQNIKQENAVIRLGYVSYKNLYLYRSWLLMLILQFLYYRRTVKV